MIKEYILKTNHWHNLREVKEKYLGRLREEYLDNIFSKLNSRRVLAITGIRRSGKSTLLYQTINQLIDKEKVEPKKILYVKIDDINFEIEDFNDVLKIYEQTTGYNVEEDECYIFVDEIQKLKNWQNQFKRYIDHKYKSIFVVSGSSRTLIYKDANESLLGRISFLNVYPLTFREFLEFNDIEIPIQGEDILDLDNAQRLSDSIYNKDRIIYYFNEYLEVGGFPEWFSVKDKDLWTRTLKEEYLDLFLFKDVVKVFNIRNPTILQKLFIFLSKNSANRFSINKISQILDIDRQTVELYLNYLESAGLIYISEKYTKKMGVNEKSEKKIYIAEEGFRRAQSYEVNEDFSYENILMWHMQKIGILYDFLYKPMYYYKKYEVDYIFRKKDFILPIEVKNTSKDVKINGLLEFMKEFKTNRAVVITKDRLEIKENIYYIPLWLFLLL